MSLGQQYNIQCMKTLNIMHESIKYFPEKIPNTCLLRDRIRATYHIALLCALHMQLYALYTCSMYFGDILRRVAMLWLHLGFSNEASPFYLHPIIECGKHRACKSDEKCKNNMCVRCQDGEEGCRCRPYWGCKRNLECIKGKCVGERRCLYDIQDRVKLKNSQ